MVYLMLGQAENVVSAGGGGTFHNPKETQRKDSAEVSAKSSSNG